MRDVYVNSNLASLKEFTTRSRSSTDFKQMVKKTIPISTKYKLWKEAFNLKKSQLKLRQQHDQNFPLKQKTNAEQILASGERNKSERAEL